MKTRTSILLVFICMEFLACVQEMAVEGRLSPYGSINDKPIARLQPEHTIARGQLKKNRELSEGKQGDNVVQDIPVPLTYKFLQRGRERYEIFCAVCHGLTGSGNGVIVERGFLAPPSYHQDRLRMAPAGHLFNVIRHGFGAMYDYADRLSVNDSWAIVGYIRALQMSQNIRLENLSPKVLKDALRDLK